MLEPHIHSIFLQLFFADGILQTICLGLPQTMILPISAFQVARITGMSHQHLDLKILMLMSFDVSAFYYELCVLSGIFKNSANPKVPSFSFASFSKFYGFMCYIRSIIHF
jgi:hypothetical protein